MNIRENDDKYYINLTDIQYVNITLNELDIPC